MRVIEMKTMPTASEYTNRGQVAEQIFRYTITGEICKADNKPHTECGDCGDIQVKSARATICKGTDIQAYLDEDKATEFAYITKTMQTAYIMTKTEWYEFATAFATITTESAKNGGAVKMRLRQETRAMIEWLCTRA